MLRHLLVAWCFVLFAGAPTVWGQSPRKGTAATKPAAKPVPSPPAATKDNVLADRERRKAANTSEWKLKNYKGRSYVPIDAVAKFYGFDSFDVSGKSVTMTRKTANGILRFSGTIGQKRVGMGNLAFYFSYPILSFGGKPAMLSTFDVSNVLDPILRGSARRDPAVLRVVVLDPAGGGVERGYVTPYGEEKELTLSLALRMKPLLEQAGFTVVLTRDEDVAVFPLERVRLANLIRNEAIYISIRANGSNVPTGKGFETSTLPPATTPATLDPEDTEGDKRFYPGNISDRESMALATTVHSSVIGNKDLRPTDLGIKRTRFEELRGIEMPAIVARVGYLSNLEEAKKLSSDTYRQELSKSMVGGIISYAEFLKRGLDERQVQDAAAPLRFGNIQSTHLDAAAGISGEKVLLRIPIIAKPGVKVDTSKLEMQVFLFERVNGIDIDLTVANPPKTEWLSVLPDWIGTQTEELQVIFDRPAMNSAEMNKMGRRNYYGYVARLIYDGFLLDEASDPKNLNRCLFYFTPVFPRR